MPQLRVFRDRSPRGDRPVSATRVLAASSLTFQSVCFACAVFVACALGLVACSGASEDVDAAAADSSTSSADAGEADSDSDGVPDRVDCDVVDPLVGREAARDCGNACGPGTAACTDGSWGGCSAPTDCLCDSEGATRSSACGMCGAQGLRCESGRWSPTSECLGEGECSPGAVEERRWRCGLDQRLCDDGCAWGEWEVVVPPGDCEPGEAQCSFGDWACTDDCRMVDNPCCPVVAGCPGGV